jgi:hypothetical protein
MPPRSPTCFVARPESWLTGNGDAAPLRAETDARVGRCCLNATEMARYSVSFGDIAATSEADCNQPQSPVIPAGRQPFGSGELAP